MIKPRSPGPVIRWLRWLHLYAGLVLAVPLLVLFASGIALVFKTDYWQWQHPELSGPPPEMAPAAHAHAIGQLSQRFDPAIELVKLPQPELSAYHLWLADGSEVLVDPFSLEIVDHWHWWQRPTGWLAEIHLHLLADEVGSSLIGWIGLALALLMISGVIVWWPQRGRFRWTTLWPHGFSRGRLLVFHRNLGVVVVPLALVLILCGAGVAFFQPARVLLNGLFGDAQAAMMPLAAPPERVSEPGSERPLADLLTRAESVLPAGRVTFVYPDLAETGVLTLRKKMSGEAHPNGLSFIHLDRGSGEPLRVVDAAAAPPGDRIANWLYPLHSGKWGGRTWQWVVALNGLILAGLVVAGVLAWWRTPVRDSRLIHRGGSASW